MRGTIQSRGKGVWRIRVDAGTDPVTGHRRQASRTVHGLKRDAEAELAKMVLAHRNRQAEASVTLEVLVSRWLDGADLSPLTRQRYAQAARLHLLPALGAKPVARVTVYDLDQLYRSMTEAGHAPASVRKVHQVAATALAQGVRWGWLGANPALQASPPRVPRRELVPPSTEMVRRAFAAAAEEDPDFATFVHLAAVTGCRRAELCALRWSDLDFDRGVLTVRRAVIVLPGGRVVEKSTKTDDVRRMTLPPTTVVNLATHRIRVAERLLAAGIGQQRDGYVFPAPFDPSRPARPDLMSHRWARLREAIGAGDVRLHDLRHHSATELIAGGVDLRTVMARLGWRNLATAERYIHVVEAKDRAAAEVLERALGGE